MLKGIIVNKLVQSSSSQPSKMTIVPSNTIKSPTKILPAPTVNTQVKASTISNQQSSFSSSNKSSVQQSPQKVIIRQVSWMHVMHIFNIIFIFFKYLYANYKIF